MLIKKFTYYTNLNQLEDTLLIVQKQTDSNYNCLGPMGVLQLEKSDLGKIIVLNNKREYYELAGKEQVELLIKLQNGDE